MARLVFDSDQGDVIKVGGVCYYFDQKTDDVATGGTVDEVFNNCADCASPASSPTAAESSPEIAASSPEAVNICAPDPEIKLTVTGPSGTINWCGETWNLPADSGVEKSACPTSYTHEGATDLSSMGLYSTFTGSHLWQFGSDIYLLRRAEIRGAPPFPFKNLKLVNKVSINGTYDYFYQAKFWQNATPYFSSTFASTGLGFLTNYYGVSAGNSLIGPAMLGSVVQGGTTFTWAKGAGWPS